MKMGKKKDEKTGIKGEETQQKATYLKEEIKKSSMHAKDSYDYKKLCVDRRGLLPCKYEEDREDLYFYYDRKNESLSRYKSRITREKISSID